MSKGGISQRTDSTWRGKVDFGVRLDGRHDYKTAYKKTREDVLQKMKPCSHSATRAYRVMWAGGQ